ncbi:MAG: acyl-CoA thioesterase [Flavobacterium sp.]
MIYWIIKSILSKNKTPDFSIDDTIISQHKVKISDLDIYWHVNNAIYLRKYEIARWNFGIKTGLTKQLLKHNIKFIVCAAELVYLKELKWNQSFEIHTKQVGSDAKYFYWEQKIFSKGKLVNHGLFKVLFLGKKGIIATHDIYSILNIEPNKNELPLPILKWKELMLIKQNFNQM